MHDSFLERNILHLIDTFSFFEKKDSKGNFDPFYFGQVNHFKASLEQKEGR